MSAGLLPVDAAVFAGGLNSFAGGIFNASGGVISAAHTGVAVSGISIFSGGITNNGAISAGGQGIEIDAVSTFTGKRCQYRNDHGKDRHQHRRQYYSGRPC